MFLSYIVLDQLEELTIRIKIYSSIKGKHYYVENREFQTFVGGMRLKKSLTEHLFDYSLLLRAILTSLYTNLTTYFVF